MNILNTTPQHTLLSMLVDRIIEQIYAAYDSHNQYAWDRVDPPCPGGRPDLCEHCAEVSRVKARAWQNATTAIEALRKGAYAQAAGCIDSIAAEVHEYTVDFVWGTVQNATRELAEWQEQ